MHNIFYFRMFWEATGGKNDLQWPQYDFSTVIIKIAKELAIENLRGDHKFLFLWIFQLEDL